MATKYFMSGGVDAKWSTDGNWSTTASSGPANTTKAVNGDAAILDAGSPACTVDVASAATSIVCTGYTNTLTFSATLTLAGTCTLASGMTIAGTSDLICNTTATLTSAGKTLTGGLQLKGTNQTYTFADAWSITGLWTFSGTTAIFLSGTFTHTVAGGITVTTNTSISVGTPTISMTGGTWSGAGNLTAAHLTFTSGTVTISGTVSFGGRTLTYAGGTLAGASTPILTIATSPTTVTGFSGTTAATGQMPWAVTVTPNMTATLGSALNIGTNTLTISCATMTFVGAYGITCGSCNITNSTPTITLSGTLTGTGDLTGTSVTSITFAGDFAIQFATCSMPGGLIWTIVHDVTITGVTTVSVASTINGSGKTWYTAGLTTTGNLNSGTANFVLNGGTWTGAAGSMNTALSIAGDVTLSGTILIGAVTLTYTSGTVTPGSSTLSLGSAVTFVTFGGTTLASVTITAAITVTINTSALTLSGTLTMPNAAVTFAGTAGWTVGTLTNTALTATRITTFTNGNTYTVTSAMSTESTDLVAEKHSWVSASPGTRYNFVLGPGATQDIAYVDATDADSSGGQMIFTFRGAAPSNCINWSNATTANSQLAWPTYQLGA